MAQLQHFWPLCNAALLGVPPILYLLGGVGGQLASARKRSVAHAWRLAHFTSTVALFFSLVCCADALLQAASLTRRPQIDTLTRFGAVHLSFRFDLIESLMLVLVAFLGWVIVRYSRAYMAGDPKEPSYVGHLMRTLAAVSLLVVTNNLIVFLAAWVLTSLSLHGLLTLYPNRQAAVIAAHKKFLASRLGDLTLLCGVVLLGSQAGSFEMDAVVYHVAGLKSVPGSIHVAACLLAISAIIKCAQLPLHGWLIQVMEAPTPVSALLHAGVVNLGGFMLIRLAPVIDSTHLAQSLLVVVGCLTATISSLVMTTRISIKVHLAWSTCAQMGFMLMECGLGLYDLAFLHLLSHSLYKAYAFLGSGGAVNQSKLKRMAPAGPKMSFTVLVAGGLFGVFVSTLAALVWRPGASVDAALILCIPIVGFAIAGILASVLSARSLAAAVVLAIAAIGVSLLYFGYDTLFQKVVPGGTIHLAQQRPVLFFAVGCFVVLYAIQTTVRVNPLGQFATTLYPWFYAGLYLDEVFTRATFHLWPANKISRVSPRRDVTQPFETAGGTL